MTKQTTGERQPIDKTKLAEAVRIVKNAIYAEVERLEKIAGEEECDPVMLEGETATGYAVRVLADPAKVAKIMLSHWYDDADDEYEDDEDDDDESRFNYGYGYGDKADEYFD